MTNETILKKAIEKAVKNGYDFPYIDFDKLSHMEIIYGDYYWWADIIFSHDFAKAFWGEKYVYYLREMVREKEPLKYIEKFLNG